MDRNLRERLPWRNNWQVITILFGLKNLPEITFKKNGIKKRRFVPEPIYQLL